MTVTMQYAWLRRGELLGLRWSAVELANPDGARLHVRETIVRGHRGDPKTDDGERTIALDDPLAEQLWQHQRRSSYGSRVTSSSAIPRRGRRSARVTSPT
jgi:integrase